jgi:hypothetical protein
MSYLKSLLLILSIYALANNVIHCQNYKKFSYFPLSVGNKWFFSQGNDGVIKKQLEIQKDTILSDGYSYSKFNLQSIYFDYSSSLYEQEYFYLRKVNNTIVEYPNRIILDYDMNIGDTVYVFFRAHYPSVLNRVATSNLFGRNLSTYAFLVSSYNYYSFTDSIGFNTLMGSTFQNWMPENLLGCVVDGKVFGNVITGIEKHNEVFVDYKLYQNYPNPFNPVTKIKYSIPKGSQVIIKVYDVLGKEVSTLVNQFRNTGVYEVEFNASNIPSGVYFYKMISDNIVNAKKLLLLK